MNPKTRETANRLNLIRILSSAPNGLSLEELKLISGISSDAELKKSLGKLYMVGTYPYSPMDYLELDYDGTNVRLIFPQNPNKTLVLTSREWLLLRDSIELEISNTDKTSPNWKTLQGILTKIKKILPYDKVESFTMTKTLIRESISVNQTILFDYTTRDGDRIESRKVDPWLLIEDNNDYLIGYCHTRKSTRNFRLESITNLTLTEFQFEKPKQSISQSSLDQFQKLLHSQSIESEIAEFYHTRESYYYLNDLFDLTTNKNPVNIDGREMIQSTCMIRETKWFIDNLIGFLPDVILTKPIYLVDQIQKLASFAKRHPEIQ
ncbi:helix-turn-helix transcriptional regulator [Leptospira sp. GIMC2001]|uniref:helix-turn-helix transcriptional regulator n=1 Tax=Leptospira sp. GIMC2001 TaxID=1513297 RepID=UPI002349D23A|nr:WYL domain-containing protein [Leptospira sp. GIMC2001]WCL49965.1 WYL domain-containing protein [Leptospira sp. GIMC2001]